MRDITPPPSPASPSDRRPSFVSQKLCVARAAAVQTLSNPDCMELNQESDQQTYSSVIHNCHNCQLNLTKNKPKGLEVSYALWSMIIHTG